MASPAIIARAVVAPPNVANTTLIALPTKCPRPANTSTIPLNSTSIAPAIAFNIPSPSVAGTFQPRRARNGPITTRINAAPISENMPRKIPPISGTRDRMNAPIIVPTKLSARRLAIVLLSAPNSSSTAFGLENSPRTKPLKNTNAIAPTSLPMSSQS